jgi:hypothetical protein
MEIALAVIGIAVAVVIGIWQIWLAYKQNKVSEENQRAPVPVIVRPTTGYEDKVVDYLNSHNVASLVFASVTKSENRTVALRMNQGRKVVVDKPVYWKDLYTSETDSFPSHIHIETTHSRDVKPEGRGHHSREVPNRAVHTIEFLLSNSGGKTLVARKINLIILDCEPNYDYHVLGMTIEAGPVHTFTIEGIELSPDKSDLVLQDKLVQIEPNGVVAYKISFKSKNNYTYRVKLAFDWVDVGSGEKKTSFSEVFVLDFPSYGLGMALGEIERAENIEVTPLIFDGKLNPLIAKILLNPKHNYYDEVMGVLKYDSTRPASSYIHYLEEITEDKNAPAEIQDSAKVSLLLLKGEVSGSLRSRETDKSVAQKKTREKTTTMGK